MGTPKAKARTRKAIGIADEPLAGALQAAREGRDAEAEATLDAAIERYSGQPGPLHAKAIFLQARGRSQEAHEAILQILALGPAEREVLLLLGHVLFDLEQDRPALAILEPLAKKDPKDWVAAQRLLAVRMRLAEVEGVLELTERWLPQRPADPHLIASHAWALEMQGDLETAGDLYEALIVTGQREADAWHRLARMRRPLDRAAIQELADDTSLADQERSVAAFALGEACKQEKDHSAAFKAFALGNQLMGVKHDRVKHREQVERTLEVCQGPLLEKLAKDGDPDEAPVFIVGMPRSGTSLVEQILGAHSGIQQLGERPEIADYARTMGEWSGLNWPMGMLSMTKRISRRQARRYKEAVGVDPSALRFTDKAPGNWHFLGLIAALFPNAKIVHCRRNPLDTILSNFFTNFGTTRVTASYDLEDLRWNYENHLKAMAHWKEVLPLPILDVDYELLVTGGEPQMRRLVEFTGLEWEEACGRPHESRTRCMTASSHQVSQPIHRGSVGTWRKYEEHLTELLPLLDTWQDPLAKS